MLASIESRLERRLGLVAAGNPSTAADTSQAGGS